MTLRLLTLSTLYPNAALPNHGIFVETRLAHLVAHEDVETRIVAPVPYFPPLPERVAAAFGRWGRYAGVPRTESRRGLKILHPRYPVIPRVTSALTPRAVYHAYAAGHDVLARQGFAADLIDAHYLYPDGVAAIWLARRLGLPAVLTARGSDVTEWPDFPGPARLIRAAIRDADALIAVSDALAERLRTMGANPDRVTTLRNGVDTSLFRPVDRDTARHDLGRDRPYIASVGHLIPRKGHDLAIRALSILHSRGRPELDLLIIGEGPELRSLRELAISLGLGDRVVFLGALPQARLCRVYSGAESLILASHREGWANVLLESMACGTPVVASPAMGNAEVVREPAAGRIAAANTPEALATALAGLLNAPPAREATRLYAERHGWREVSAGQMAVFNQVRARCAVMQDA